jgi:hypothetical protein
MKPGAALIGVGDRRAAAGALPPAPPPSLLPVTIGGSSQWTINEATGKGGEIYSGRNWGFFTWQSHVDDDSIQVGDGS